MGLFKTKEEKEMRRKEKELEKEKKLMFFGDTMQSIGKIPMGKPVGLTLKPDKEVLNIHHDKIDITLPYERIKGFKIDNEVNLAKSGGTIGRSLVGGALFGGTGAIIGGISGKGNTTIKWFATLNYEDKDGNMCELNFIQRMLTGYYEGEQKHWGAAQFENKVNEIVSRYAENITEL